MYPGRCSRSGKRLADPHVVARRAHVLSTVLVLGIVLSGCASTRIAEVGTLPNGDRLITLVVSEDRQVVHRQCQDVPALGLVLGCQTSRALALPNGVAVRAVKIVRYTDVLPSRMAFEIDAHELCHAIAAVQSIEDPCHAVDHGIVESSGAAAPSTRALTALAFAGLVWPRGADQ